MYDRETQNNDGGEFGRDRAPERILERLRVAKGDRLYATETPDGIELRAYDDEFADDMEMAEKIMRDNRDLLRKLAE